MHKSGNARLGTCSRDVHQEAALTSRVGVAVRYDFVGYLVIVSYKLNHKAVNL
jgi:hypothetical protein